MRVPKQITSELAATRLPYSIVDGRKHKHIYLDGKMIGILPFGSKLHEGRVLQNVIHQIRRAARRVA